MRQMSSAFAEKVASKEQTKANKSEPRTYLRITRHDVPLQEKQFIEKSRIVNREGLTDSDIAVCHPTFGRESTTMWVAYVRSGVLHIKYADNHEVMTRSEWIDYSFTTEATACAIGFDSTVKHNASGLWEFITEEVPWVFWVDENGALKAKMCTPLGVQIIELAAANVTDVSVVRGPSGEYGNWNLGLTVFFLMGGSIYYRQLIDGEWYDAELVQFTGLSDLTISEIKAFNTWDYRVGVQILTDDGNLYELFTYTEGIGTRGTEHIEFSLADVDATLTEIIITTTDLKNADEHIEFGAQGHACNYSINGEVPRSASNIEDVNGNYGTTIDVVMSEEVYGAGISQFTLTDGANTSYTCRYVEYVGRAIRLTFDDFNNATGNLTVTYTSGTLTTPILAVASFSVTFEPVRLGSSVPDIPAFAYAENDGDSTIYVHFDKALTDNDLDIPEHITVRCYEYDMVPGGTLGPVILPISSTEALAGTNNTMVLHLTEDMNSSVGTIEIIYDGQGGLENANGQVLPFERGFTPTGLTWWGHQNDEEHIEFSISEVTAVNTLITYHNRKNGDEHIEFAFDTATATLTYIGDL